MLLMTGARGEQGARHGYVGAEARQKEAEQRRPDKNMSTAVGYLGLYWAEIPRRKADVVDMW